MKKIEQGKNSYLPKANIQKAKKSKVNVFGICMWAFAFLAVIFFVICLKKPGFNSNSVSFSEFKGDSPQLVFESVDFYKYVIHGTPDGTNEKLDKLVIYNVSGTAEFAFDLNAVSVKKKNRKNIVEIDDKDYFPVTVNVISTNCVKVDEIEAVPISKEEANAVAKKVAVVTGFAGAAGGAVAGKTAGASFGKFLSKVPGASMVAKFVGAGIGAVAGGTAGAKSGYDMTNNFLIERRLTSEITMTEVEQVNENAKFLVALELISEFDNVNSYDLLKDAEDGDVNLYEQWRDKTRKPYQIELEKTLRDLFNMLGINDCEFEYTSGATPLTDKKGEVLK